MFVQTSARLKQTRPIGTNIGANQEGTARSTTAGSTRPSCAGRPGPQGQAAPQGKAQAPQGRARGAARQDPRDQVDIGEAGRGRGPRAPRGLGGRHRGRQGRRRLPGHARRPREPPAGGRALAGPHQEGGRRDAGGGPRGPPRDQDHDARPWHGVRGVRRGHQRGGPGGVRRAQQEAAKVPGLQDAQRGHYSTVLHLL